jgi:hypothetical protein
VHFQREPLSLAKKKFTAVDIIAALGDYCFCSHLARKSLEISLDFKSPLAVRTTSVACQYETPFHFHLVQLCSVRSSTTMHPISPHHHTYLVTPNLPNTVGYCNSEMPQQ